MAYYRVLLSGSDFKFDFGDGAKKGGFATTRWVKAKSPEDAELKAVRLLKDDQSLQAVSIKCESTQPMIYLEEMFRVTWLEYFRKKPGKGYTFY